MSKNQDFEYRVMDGNITVPYSWTTGYATGKFLTALRDERKILGIKCSKCGEVVCPPRDICPKCFVKNEEMVEVGPSGEVVAFSEILVPNDHQPTDPPYILALIKLDGADTNLVHVVGEVGPDELDHGTKVEPVWKEERLGLLTDIKHFKPA